MSWSITCSSTILKSFEWVLMSTFTWRLSCFMFKVSFDLRCLVANSTAVRQKTFKPYKTKKLTIICIIILVGPFFVLPWSSKSKKKKTHFLKSIFFLGFFFSQLPVWVNESHRFRRWTCMLQTYKMFPR